VTTFADRGCPVVSVTDPYGSIIGFLDRIFRALGFIMHALKHLSDMCDGNPFLLQGKSSISHIGYIQDQARPGTS
jgi:hypothetical protein